MACSDSFVASALCYFGPGVLSPKLEVDIVNLRSVDNIVCSESNCL
jgi:hypothetical protein